MIDRGGRAEKECDAEAGARRATAALLVSAAVVAWLGGAREVSSGSGPVATREPVGGWDVGRPVPVPCEGGRARFVVPSSARGSRTLVVVSTLATTGGPFPVRLAVKGSTPGAVSVPDQVEGGPIGPVRREPRPLGAVPPPGQGSPPRERSFHLLVRDGDAASASNYELVPATLRAVGTRSQVYVDRADDGTVSDAILREIVATFDGRVFPVAASTFGTARDVDGDGRFTIFLSGKLARLGGGRNAADGFVRGADLDPSYPAPFGNRCDMMYLSATLSPGPHLRTVIAHEYTHAVTFSSRPPGSEEEGWLDEALAHLVEDLHGFSRSNLDYRVSAFLSRPEGYRLVVDDYYAAGLFRGHGNRGATYLFLRWCVDRFGPGLVPALVRSDLRGAANLEAATGRPLPELFREWSVALYMSGLDPSLPVPGGYRSLSLRGRADGWDLAGPRAAEVGPGGEPLAWESAGTACRFVVVGGPADGAVEVEVEAPVASGLQVTAVPLPDDLAGLGLAVKGGEPAGTLVAELTESRGTAVRLNSLSWELLEPRPNPRAGGFRRGGLDGPALSKAFGGRDLTGLGSMSSGPVPAAEALGAGARVVVKAVGTDAKGRSVAAWADLEGEVPGLVHDSN